MPTRLNVKKVVVLLAGSRTGSSFLFRALTSSGEFISPTGEETPFYRRAGLGIFNGADYSDAIIEIPEPQILERAGREILSDIGFRENLAQDPAIFAEKILDRIEIQWPGLVAVSLRSKLHRFLHENLRHRPENLTWRDFYISCLEKLQKLGLKVEPQLLSTDSPHPMELPLLEEPPYIAPEPQRAPSKEDFLHRPLLLKTSTNIYRLPFLRALFPEAQFRFVVLTRNPLAATSALMDGWLSSGFHSHDISSTGPLEIDGYSNLIAGGERFWKFDMPPGWRNYRTSSLAEVCAFQWQSAHQALANFVASTTDPVFQLKYEDLAFGDRREEILRALIDFSGTSPLGAADWNGAEPIAAVSAPLIGKWKKREALLKKNMSTEVLKLAELFNYDKEKMDQWP